MKRFFLVEADQNYASLFCYELQETEFRKYERSDVAIFNNVNREQFFGNLNSLCLTKENLKAPPIELAPPDLVKVEEQGEEQGAEAVSLTK